MGELPRWLKPGDPAPGEAERDRGGLILENGRQLQIML